MGRLNFNHAAVDEIGKCYGKLRVVACAGSSFRGEKLWRVKCACGSPEKTVAGRHLRSGNTKSCGCLKKEVVSNLRHGFCRRKDSSSMTIYRMWCHAKSRAKRRGLVFDLQVEDIVIPEFCPVLAEPLFKGVNISHPFSPTLDRIDNRLGYVRGNIWVISRRANTLKSDANLSELRALVRSMEAIGAKG